jgi:hypothetical protein
MNYQIHDHSPVYALVWIYEFSQLNVLKDNNVISSRYLRKYCTYFHPGNEEMLFEMSIQLFIVYIWDLA